MASNPRPEATTRVLIAWELGGALGHLASLARVARALVDRGDVVFGALVHLPGAAAWMPPEVVLLQAPVLRGRAPEESHVTHADLYADLGWSQAALLGPTIQAWSNLLDLVRPDVLLVDSAPGLLLAARGRGLRTVGVNTPFATPPNVDPLPALRWWVAEADPGARAREQAVVQVANAVRPRGTEPLTCLAELFAPVRWCLKGPRVLDPWAEDRGPDVRHLGVLAESHRGVVHTWPSGSGPRVFVYLKADWPHLGRLFDELDRRGCRVLAYVPGSDRASAPGRTMLSEPARLAALFASTELVITHSALGTGCSFLERAVPVLLFPTHLEQQALARRASALPGVAAVPPGAVDGQLGRALDLVLRPAFHVLAAQAAASFGEGLDPVGAVLHALDAPLR